MNQIPSEQPTDRIEAELESLRSEMHKLNGHRFIRVHNSWRKMLFFYFVRGLATGLGTVVGATFLVSVLLFFLAQIDFIPIIGEWASRIAEQIQGG